MSAHCNIKIPPPIQLGNIWLPFGIFIRHLIDGDDRFNKSGKGARAGMRLLMALENAEVGTTQRVHPDDGDLLHAAAEQPSCGYPQLVAIGEDGRGVPRPIPVHVLLPLIDALSPENTKDAPKGAVDAPDSSDAKGQL